MNRQSAQTGERILLLSLSLSLFLWAGKSQKTKTLLPPTLSSLPLGFETATSSSPAKSPKY